MRDEDDKKENITLRMSEPKFRYLTTVMSMYVDSGKAYVQVATGALLLPIIFLRNLLGLKEQAPLGWIPRPMWISWILLLLSIGAGLLYQVKAVRYLEVAMEGGVENAPTSVSARWKQKIVAPLGLIFDLMVVTFYLGTMFFVVGAVEVMHYHSWMPCILCPGAIILTAVVYFVL